MITFAVVVLACGLKNYLSYLVSGTALCPYLCPSWLGWDTLEELPVLGTLFAAQAEMQAVLQGLADRVWSDHWNLTTKLLIAPLLEEAIYRGPLFLGKRWVHTPWWWIIGFLLSLVFALSHGRSGLALLPLIVLAICSLWLIAATGRFWPSITLHVLHNFFFTSAILYQSLWVGD
jgi:membrane protease YdiL (CAAX protease family)